MSIKRTILAATVSGVIGMGIAGPASASIYALSHMKMEGLNIGITDNLGTGLVPGTFNFSMTNTASLNGAPAIDTSSCNGTLTPPIGGSCNPTFPGGSGANTVLGGATDIASGTGAGPNVVNAPGSTLLRAEDNYTFLGPGNGTYGNGDSVIEDAQLTGDTRTVTENTAEAELQGAPGDASGGSTIQSTTAITWDFTILPGTSGNVVLSFNADPDLLARIATPPPNDPLTATAQADVTVRFNLTQDLDGAGNPGTGEIIWSPQGTPGVNDCGVLFSAAVCNETNDTQSLNVTASVAALPNSQDDHSFEQANTPTAFGITISGIEAGQWALNLFENKKVNVTLSVPEPGMLGLLGMSLFGLGFARLRGRKRS
jgi:hypothetical protein